MKSKKMFSMVLALIMAFSLIPTQSALAADDNITKISSTSFDGSMNIEYQLSSKTVGTEKYTYETYDTRIVNKEVITDTYLHTVTVYQVPLYTTITIKTAPNVKTPYVYVGDNEPVIEPTLCPTYYGEDGYEVGRPLYRTFFTVPDTENYYFVRSYYEHEGLVDDGFCVKAVDTAVQPENLYDADIKTATPSTCKIQINERPVSLDAYVIDGSNYVKLRDISMALKGTGKQFDVTWDGKNSTISIRKNLPYTPVGGELARTDGTAKTAVPYNKTILVNGKEASPKFYTIGQNNYVKLRDIGRIINFWVDWDGANNTVLIYTTVSYNGMNSWGKKYGN